MRLLVPLLEAFPKSEEAYKVEMATEAIEDWQTPFLEFLEHGRLPINIKQRAAKNCCSQGHNISSTIGYYTPLMHQRAMKYIKPLARSTLLYAELINPT